MNEQDSIMKVNKRGCYGNPVATSDGNQNSGRNPHFNTQELINDTVAKTVAHMMEQLFTRGRIRMETEIAVEKCKFAKAKGGKNKSTRDKSSGKGRNSLNSFEHEVIGNNSEITIYERAVKDSEQLKAQQVKRISSSSEENENCGDTSDELIEVAIEEGNGNEMTGANNFGKLPNQTTNNQMLNNDSIVVGTFRQGNQRYVDDGQRPSTSRENAQTQRATEEPEEVAERIIREAELSKALVYDTPGKDDKKLLPLNMISDYVQDAIADEHYKIISTHIDQTTKTKILNNEYVDFAELLPRDRVSQEEDGRVQMIFKNGIPFYVPVNDYQQISSFSRWEQAFRVFSAIYTKNTLTEQMSCYSMGILLRLHH